MQQHRGYFTSKILVGNDSRPVAYIACDLADPETLQYNLEPCYVIRCDVWSPFPTPIHYLCRKSNILFGKKKEIVSSRKSHTRSHLIHVGSMIAPPSSRRAKCQRSLSLSQFGVISQRRLYKGSRSLPFDYFGCDLANLSTLYYIFEIIRWPCNSLILVIRSPHLPLLGA